MIAESLAKKRVEFCESAKKYKRLRKNAQRKGIGVADREWSRWLGCVPEWEFWVIHPAFS